MVAQSKKPFVQPAWPGGMWYVGSETAAGPGAQVYRMASHRMDQIKGILK